MNSVGTYEESLHNYGKLSISKSKWSIEYYFPGPDSRYNGTCVWIKETEVEAYIQAFIDNWNEFESLRGNIPEGGTFSKSGKMGMTINVGGYWEGVCLRSYNLQIKDKEKLDEIIKSYQYAIKRAAEIQIFLSKL